MFRCPRISIWVHHWSGLWIWSWYGICINFWASTNFRLVWIYWFCRFSPRNPLTLRLSIILGSSRTSPPLLWKWEKLNVFVWYLYSFGCIPCRVRVLCDTLIISKCFWQIIYNMLQIYDFLTLLFSFLSTWIWGGNVLGIPIDFLAFTMVLIISP